jgi:predicted nucleotide-binding protein
MKRFDGTLEELKEVVAATGLSGFWAAKNAKGSDPYQFRAKTGEILNWWPSTGTISCQGKNQEAFAALLNKSPGIPSGTRTTSAVVEATKKIFVVHGHDPNARDQLELVLRRLGLEPFILQNSDSGGSSTIIEALEQNIYREAAFGIVLMTPDDFGYSKTLTDADRQPRARQNVILEMGMVMAALGRERMAILQKGTLERPSDTDGILRLEFNDHVREIVPKLVQRPQSAGFDIDAKKIEAASA